MRNRVHLLVICLFLFDPQIDQLLREDAAGGVFPQELIDLWIEKKKADYQKVHSIPHPAEFSLYYDL